MVQVPTLTYLNVLIYLSGLGDVIHNLQIKQFDYVNFEYVIKFHTKDFNDVITSSRILGNIVRMSTYFVNSL